MRISNVVKETGVSRELIHHYLRQGLIPKPSQRAIYTRTQIDLLRQLKKLREDHHIPLDLIRRVFELFDFDPGHLAPFTLTDSLNKRMGHLVNGEDILSPTLSAEEIITRTGISSDRLKDYVQAKLVRPITHVKPEMFSHYDINIIHLCEQGTALGMPFESFRTIGAYVRIGFELEHKIIFDVAREQAKEEKKIFAEIFLRREVITSFIQNLLQSLISQRLMDLATLGKDISHSLDSIIYRPSPLFCQRYGIDQAIEAAQENLSVSPDRPKGWHYIARLMLHAGRYREANFFLEQALEKWPTHDALLALQGITLMLSGLYERGIMLLRERLNTSPQEPLGRVFLALSLFTPPEEKEAEREQIIAAVATKINLANLIEEALDMAQEASPEVRTETYMFAGWALTAIPPPFRNEAHGVRLLTETYKYLQQDGGADEAPVAGLRERYLINTAYLLFLCLSQGETVGKDRLETSNIPSLTELRSLICSLDPGSTFAEKVFLSTE